MFSPCVTPGLCAASQRRQTDRQGISDVFSICSGRTDMTGEDEKERRFHGVHEESGGGVAYEDLLPDVNHYLSEKPVERCCTLCGTLSPLILNSGQGLSMMPSSSL